MSLQDYNKLNTNLVCLVLKMKQIKKTILYKNINGNVHKAVNALST